MRIYFLFLAYTLMLVLFAFPDTLIAQQEPAKVTTKNKNTLIEKYRNRLQLNASTVYSGYGVESAVDGNPHTSWFSQSGDTASLGKTPWVEITFPEDITVKQVTIIGNRHSPFLENFSITVGRLEMFDKDGKRLFDSQKDGAGPAFDFDFLLRREMEHVRRIRFTSVADQGKMNSYNDVALGELQVE